MTNHRKSRRGLTFLEVLISMFVLLIGLLGIGAMIPAGRYVALQGTKLSTAAMVGQTAMHDLVIRGYLNPKNWYAVSSTATNAPIWDVTNPTAPFLVPGGGNFAALPVVIDPLAITNATGPAPFNATVAYPSGEVFPSGLTAGLYLTRVSPLGSIDLSLATNYTKLFSDLSFRSADDLIYTPGAKDITPLQQTAKDASNAAVKRASEGNYSWLATVVPDTVTLNSPVLVSVAVMYKRDLSGPGVGETTADVTINGAGIGGGEVTLSGFSTAPPKPVKSGQWIMLAYQVGAGGPYYYRWYRVIAADVYDTAGSQQYATLYGADIMAGATTIKAWLIDNVIAVYEQSMMLDLP